MQRITVGRLVRGHGDAQEIIEPDTLVDLTADELTTLDGLDPPVVRLVPDDPVMRQPVEASRDELPEHRVRRGPEPAPRRAGRRPAPVAVADDNEL